MNLSELIARLQELEKRHGPNKDVALVVKVVPWWQRPQFIIALDIFGVGTSGRPVLKDKVVIYGTKDSGEKLNG